MAAIDVHISALQNQAECLEEHGHLKQPDEFWAVSELVTAIERVRRVFVQNQEITTNGTKKHEH